MSQYGGENLQLDSDFAYQQYSPPIIPTTINISGNTVGGAVTTINGNSGAGAAGPTVTFSGGTTGMTFVAAGTTVDLSGTLAIANGGTGATSAATARTNLSVPLIHTAAVAPTAAEDGASGYPVGSLWLDTVLQNGYMSTNAGAGVAVWKQIT